MFLSFCKPIMEALIKDEFVLGPCLNGNQTLNDDTPMVVLLKEQSPLLYVVFLFNPNEMSLVGIERVTDAILTNFLPNIEQSVVTRIISLTVLPFEPNNQEVPEFVHKTSLSPEDKILRTWWAVNCKNGEIIVGNGQPTEILKIRKIILNSIHTIDLLKEYNLYELEKEIQHKTALPIRSKNSYVTYTLILINIVCFLIMILSGHREEIISLFATHSSSVFAEKEIYRLITSTFLHADLTHLGYNMLSLYIFGSRIETYFGKPYYLGFYFLCGLGGSIASIFFINGFSIGASGAIYGLIGGVLALSFFYKKTIDGLHYYTILIIVIMGLGLGFMNIQINNYAHIGGLITGFILVSLKLIFQKRG